jgi:hypothetical protein
VRDSRRLPGVTASSHEGCEWATRLEAASEAISFHPVQVVEAPPRERAQRDPIEIVLGEGYSVRVAGGFEARDLERVLGVLAGGAGADPSQRGPDLRSCGAGGPEAGL